MIDQERIFGLLFDGARDSLPVLRAEHKGAQDQQVECALQEGDALLRLVRVDIRQES